MWSKEEDQIVMDCVDSGTTDWTEISERVPGRLTKQCRDRWNNHLNPSTKKQSWTEEEDLILELAQTKWGNKWGMMTKTILTLS